MSGNVIGMPLLSFVLWYAGYALASSISIAADYGLIDNPLPLWIGIVILVVVVFFEILAQKIISQEG